MATDTYKENHYVPQWYQRRFLPSTGEQKFRYLDLRPETFLDEMGRLRQKTSLHRWGTNRCFKQTDLYTTRLGKWESTHIEQFFFGRVDDQGRKAVDYFTTFVHPSIDRDAFYALLNFMSVQKLRTPKGLAYLADQTELKSKNAILLAMQRLQHLHCAIWTESVWLIAEAADTTTKFIVSDHPITVYNEDCFPGSSWCYDFRDPEIWRLGTHTLFPLSLRKILILTNLAWVRNPYANGTKLRPNPDPLRPAIFKFTSIQTGRNLTEIEVNQINFIIKKRAYRFIAAAKEEWLYPEQNIPSDHWRKLNEQYLLMPDPRSMSFSREIVIGYKTGGSERFDEYGRRPGHKSFKDEILAEREWRTFHAFQGEFARLFGPKRRGISFEFDRLMKCEDSSDCHQHYLDLEKKFLPPHVRPRRGRRST
ncbi:MAG: DUF4238 domain-containing protein [Rhodospirillales bacterium]